MEVLVGALLIAAAILGGFVVLGRRRPGDEVVSQAVRTEFQTLFQLSEERVARQMESGANELQGKKALIDQQLQGMHGELAKVSDLMRTLERDREGKFGELTTQLKAIGEQTAALTTSTQDCGRPWPTPGPAASGASVWRRTSCAWWAWRRV